LFKLGQKGSEKWLKREKKKVRRKKLKKEEDKLKKLFLKNSALLYNN